MQERGQCPGGERLYLVARTKSDKWFLLHTVHTLLWKVYCYKLHFAQEGTIHIIDKENLYLDEEKMKKKSEIIELLEINLQNKYDHSSIIKR